jgi:predicted GNAT family acetyltransferase
MTTVLRIGAAAPKCTEQWQCRWFCPATGAQRKFMPNEIRDNPDRNRFEMDAGNDVAVVNYRLAPGVITLSHTEVPEELEGQGLGSRIVRGVLDIVRGRGLKVVPACGFVAAFIRKNPDYRDLLV